MILKIKFYKDFRKIGMQMFVIPYWDRWFYKLEFLLIKPWAFPQKPKVMNGLSNLFQLMDGSVAGTLGFNAANTPSGLSLTTQACKVHEPPATLGL